MNRSKELSLISKRIRDFYRTLKSEFNQIFESQKITNGEFLFLRSLNSGLKTNSTLAKELGVSLPYITSLSDKMIKKGYIERNYSKEDRRINHIKLTRKGKGLYLKLDQMVNKYLESKFNHLEHNDLKQFNELLKKILEI